MYRVQLKNFEGPLDLLLFFIRRDELDIYDIPVSHITSEFLGYIRLMEELDLDVASEFILMASILMSIKAKMMLPRDETEDEEFDEEDPRYELVQKLLEYKRYKEMAGRLTEMDEDTRKKYYRGYLEEDEVDKQMSGEALRNVTIIDLIAAYQNVLSDIKKQNAFHHIEKESVTVEEQSAYILNSLQKNGRSSFRALCVSFQSRLLVVVTFLAVLEMLKEQQLDLYMEDDPTDFHLGLKAVDEIIGSGVAISD